MYQFGLIQRTARVHPLTEVRGFLPRPSMKKRGPEIKTMWDLIPDSTDILVTHGPPHGILDSVVHGATVTHVGCEELTLAVQRIKPKVHVFGHVHEGYGMQEINGTIFVNASHVDERYRPVNKPIRVIL